MKSLLAAFFTAFLLCGCFSSEQPFYQASDIVSDDRLVGTFVFDFYDGHHRWIVNKVQGGVYGITVEQSPDYSMKFEGVLFQVGTNRFLDLLPKVERYNPPVHDVPGLVDLLQAATVQTLHMVVKVEVGTNEVQVGGYDKKAINTAMSKAPEFFASVNYQEGRAKLIADTKREREFLLRFGGDTNVFLLQPMKRERLIK